ncbi:uncharacterized protein METZ01_LOCUS11588 [marine metagenome]|uniref:Uncharacterized protein n=1 Tax=marine metagenome TaxID=408172 RepID=A0A381NX38_9ZZZZ
MSLTIVQSRLQRYHMTLSPQGCYPALESANCID